MFSSTRSIGLLSIHFFLCFFAIALHAQNQGDNSIGREVQDGPKFRFSGEMTGMNTIGLQENDQAIESKAASNPSGIFINKKNSFYTSISCNMLFNPVSTVDVYAKVQARYRPGSPYIPLQLSGASSETFSISMDSAYGRINVLKGLSLTSPADLFIKVGKYNTSPSNFQNVSRYGAESVMSKLQTNSIYALQLEAAYSPPWADSLGLSATTNQLLNQQITQINGDTGETIEDKFDFPLHLALKVKKITSPFGPISAELLYVYNAEDFYSGNNFGADLGWEIMFPGHPNVSFPIGMCFARYEKNIDPFAETALDSSNRNFVNSDPNDQNTTSFRESIRTGLALGLRYGSSNNIKAEINSGFSLSRVAHVYRETISIGSLSLDLRLTFGGWVFAGGGLFLGTLSNTEWKTKDAVDPANDSNGYVHVFKPGQNLGYEVFTGLQFSYARFVLGFNCSRGLAMGRTIESISDSQVKYRQKGSAEDDRLYETGGIFTKLSISW